MLRNFKLIFVVMIIFVLMGSTYAFAAANTIPDTSGGSGTSTVSGFDITDIIYDLDAVDPTVVDEITFTLTPTTGTVPAVKAYVKTAAAGAWTECAVGADLGVGVTDVTCTFGALTFVSVTELSVVASSTNNP